MANYDHLTIKILLLIVYVAPNVLFKLSPEWCLKSTDLAIYGSGE